jgi:GTP cyclohydrolase I
MELQLPTQDDKIANHARAFITLLGENPDREGLKDTPKRFAKSMRFLTSGYTKDPDKVVNGALFTESSKDLVMVRDIEFFSLCEHHVLPFYGKVHIGYLPNGRVIGLSKLPRLVEVFARRLQLQERLTTQIADELNRILKPRGLAIVIEAWHMCMMMRGVEKQNSFTVTHAVRGTLASDPMARDDFFRLLESTRRRDSL